jgi:hypothetical protein
MELKQANNLAPFKQISFKYLFNISIVGAERNYIFINKN